MIVLAKINIQTAPTSTHKMEKDKSLKTFLKAYNVFNIIVPRVFK